MYKNVCSPGADAMAVWYRASMLRILQILPESPLRPWTYDGELEDAVFQVAAKFPMKKMQVGVEQEGFPFVLPSFFLTGALRARFVA
jgi:hypothetical protein